MKKVICFDLDGTLAESKSEMTDEMAQKIGQLTMKYQVAVISGGAYKQYQKQFLPKLHHSFVELDNLFLFPTCATSFYRYKGEGYWEQVYEELLSEEEKKIIINTFHKYLPSYFTNEYKNTCWGEVLEDRGTQITFSAMGQQAPVEKKKVWDPDLKKRRMMQKLIQKRLPENIEARTGGSTSLDVTRKGIDKAYGIEKIKEYLRVDTEEILFIGDALYKDGNDEPVKRTGVECISIEGPEDTIKEINKLL